MKKRILGGISAFLVVLLVYGAWRIFLFQRPFSADEIPEWRVQEMEEHQWLLYAKEDPQRFTSAWISENPNGNRCDTVVLLGGLDVDHQLVNGADHIPDHGNVVALRHPLQQFISLYPVEKWTWRDWLATPQRIKKEMAHTVGALRALLHYLRDPAVGPERFTQRVVLAGGSFGGPFPVMVTSFEPKSVAALMVIYGFTNYSLVISREVERQGRIHLKMTKDPETIGEIIKLIGLRALAKSLGFLLGNMVKYGEMESYFSKIDHVPTYFINGRADHLVPPEAFDPMWNSASAPKFQEWIEGDHINPGDPKALQNIISHLYDWNQTQHVWGCEDKAAVLSP